MKEAKGVNWFRRFMSGRNGTDQLAVYVPDPKSPRVEVYTPPQDASPKVLYDFENWSQTAIPVSLLERIGPVSLSAGDVNNVTAFILSWLLGWCGIHRHYCGTAPWMWAVYLVTGGGLGILWSVDTILLFLDVIGVGEGYLGKFINNQKIIAWI